MDCQFCSFQTARFKLLKEHILLVHNLFICSKDCNQTFASKCSLKYHQECTHSKFVTVGEYRITRENGIFQCPSCSFAASNPRKFHQHARQVGDEHFFKTIDNDGFVESIMPETSSPKSDGDTVVDKLNDPVIFSDACDFVQSEQIEQPSDYFSESLPVDSIVLNSSHDSFLTKNNSLYLNDDAEQMTSLSSIESPSTSNSSAFEQLMPSQPVRERDSTFDSSSPISRESSFFDDNDPKLQKDPACNRFPHSLYHRNEWEYNQPAADHLLNEISKFHQDAFFDSIISNFNVVEKSDFETVSGIEYINLLRNSNEFKRAEILLRGTVNGEPILPSFNPDTILSKFSVDIDSFIWVGKDFPCSGIPVRIYPVPNYRGSLTKNNGIQVLLTNKEEGTEELVRLSTIPNLELASLGSLNIFRVRVFFPDMRRKSEKNIWINLLTGEQIREFYDNCVFNALKRCQEDAKMAHYPPSYKVAYNNSRNNNGSLSFSGYILHKALVPKFFQVLKDLSCANESFGEFFFEITCKDIKLATFSNNNYREHVLEFVNLFPFFDTDSLLNGYTFFDIGCEISKPAMVSVWKQKHINSFLRGLDICYKNTYS